MGRRRSLLGGSLVGAVTLVAAACGATDQPGHAAAPMANAPTRADAGRSANDLGPVQASTPVALQMVLRPPGGADPAQMLASGRTVTPAEYARRFLPPTSLVQAALTDAHRAGLNGSWTPGSTQASLSGPAGAVERYFGVRLDQYRSPSGSTYFAPVGPGPVGLPSAWRQVASTAAGLDSRGQMRTMDSATVSSGSTASAGSGRQAAGGGGCGQPIPGGYSPSQVESAYNIAPVTAKGIDGTGQTVVFIEIDTFDQRDLDCFAGQFNESPITVSTAPQTYGNPNTTDHGEADMDIEIVHSVAPGAKLVVYYGSGKNPATVEAATAAAVQAYPNAILSISLGACELDGTQTDNPQASSTQSAFHAAFTQLGVTGGSAYVSSGDQGAFICQTQSDSGSSGGQTPTVSYPASDPAVTAVGGTALFVGSDGAYAGEGTWGGPFDGSGGGGGVSAIFDQPSWQTGPGVKNQYSNGKRQLPDVAGLADPNTGWDIFQGRQWILGGGTSAAAPLWAGVTALADETLSRQHQKPVGFANPALYYFGSNATSQPAQAFFDVTKGNNLYYAAGPGWDFATGWGSPNTAGLIDDFVAYREAGH